MNDSFYLIGQKIKDGAAITLKEAEDFIMKPLNNSMPAFSGNNGFNRSKYFLKLLGNPQDNNKTIHIAGTSGKGSVVAILEHLLNAHSKSTASYSSPHVYNLRERWKHNTKMASIDDLTFAIKNIYPAILTFNQTKHSYLTYFEITTAVSFILNKLWDPDYAIIETGVGGLLDTTNTITRDDKLAIITELGYDHTQILGSSLPEIANQKAGIIAKNGYAIVLGPKDTQTKQAIETSALSKKAQISYVNDNHYSNIKVTKGHTIFDYKSDTLYLSNLNTSLIGSHQAKNVSLAISALEFISKRDNFKLNEKALRQALINISLPGRFEKRLIGNQSFICDGAHNPQKLEGLVNTLKNIYPNQKFTWLLAIGKTKDSYKSLETIRDLVDKLYLTTFFTNQNITLSSKSSSINSLREIAKEVGIDNVMAYKDSGTALESAINNTNNSLPIIVTGSFYLLSDLFSNRN